VIQHLFINLIKSSVICYRQLLTSILDSFMKRWEETIAFGVDAEERFKCLQEEGHDPKQWYFFQNFRKVGYRRIIRFISRQKSIINVYSKSSKSYSTPDKKKQNTFMDNGRSQGYFLLFEHCCLDISKTKQKTIPC